MADEKRITVFGAGMMGTAISVAYAQYGYNVHLHDVAAGALDSLHDRARPLIEAAVDFADGDESADDIGARLNPERDFDSAVGDSFLVHEIVQEDLAVKQSLFKRLDAALAPEVVMATNTSSYLLTNLAEGIGRKEKLIGIHFVSPAHIIPVVEIITASFTPESLVDWARGFLATIGKVGVVCRESPGFLLNRIQLALMAEAHKLVDEGLATPEDVDNAIQLALGTRLALWGPMILEDINVSKKTVAAVLDYIRAETGNDHFTVTDKLRGMIDAGSLGAVSGSGWYDWDAPFEAVAAERDRKLIEIVKWLRDRGGMSSARPKPSA